MLKTLKIEIDVNEVGAGKTVTKVINGYVKLVSLPKNALYNLTKVQLRPENNPLLMFQLSMKEGEREFRVKIPTSDLFGTKTPEMADLPVAGKLEVGVGGAVPDSIFTMTVLYDTVE